ncbi:MAG: hypothetical protein JWN04_1503, partial [Myxococcaceae bacterium]|nr:hypothetical protein [Myxococcaceae bacterium]
RLRLRACFRRGGGRAGVVSTRFLAHEFDLVLTFIQGSDAFHRRRIAAKGRYVEIMARETARKRAERAALTAIVECRMLSAMRLDSASLAELRDQLRARGRRASLAPAALGTASDAPRARPPGPLSPDALAVVQRVSPLCEVLYLLLIADGRQDASELEVLRGAVRALTDNALRSAEIDDMLALYAARLENQSREQRLEQITAQLSFDRSDAEATFTLAAAMAIADDQPDLREQAMLGELRELLGIAPARAATLLGDVLDAFPG